MAVHHLELERLFDKLCAEKPLKSAVKRLKGFSDRTAVVAFLVGKLERFTAAMRAGDEGQDSAHEWGIIHTCSLLGDLKAPEAAVPLVEILDLVVDSWDTYLHNSVMLALNGMGTAALETACEKFQRARLDMERKTTWLWVLADLGVKDSRIHHALVEHTHTDLSEAVNIMGHYGDRGFLPIMQQFVEETAEYLNENKINPLVAGARMEDPHVDWYINCRESLVMLRDEIEVDDPEFDAKVEALDRELLDGAFFDDGIES